MEQNNTSNADSKEENAQLRIQLGKLMKHFGAKPSLKTDKIVTNKDLWIRGCFYTFFDRLQKLLNISKTEVDESYIELRELVNQFYSFDHFDEDKQKELMDYFEYILKIKKHIPDKITSCYCDCKQAMVVAVLVEKLVGFIKQ